jgi:hypothetical protein
MMFTIVTGTLMAIGAAFILYWLVQLIVAITVVVKWK